MNTKLLKKIYTLLLSLIFIVATQNLKANFNFDENVPTRSGEEDEIFAQLGLIVADIQTPLWNKTKPPKGRDVLYLMPHRISTLEYGGFVSNFFFNYTDKMGFSTDETLKLDENKAALEQLTELLISNVGSQEASSLIPLFKKLTIQERKLGALLQAAFLISSFKLELNSSLQLSERNFWLSKIDQNRIAEMFGDGESTFDENELKKFKFGLGDTRVKLGLNSLNMPNFQVDLGFEGIFPTSKISTDPRLKQYDMNLENLVNDVPDLLKGIRDNLIAPQLGNYGHFGFGCFMETKINLFHNSLHLWNRLSFDNLFAAKEDRLIPSKKTLSPDDIFGLDLEDPADQAIFTEFIKEYIFPPAYRVNMRPGDIINFVTALSFELGKKWDIGFGYDYYHQQKEKVMRIYTDENIDSLRVDDAISYSATQHKLFAQADFIKRGIKRDITLGFGADYTISSENLGHDWTIFGRIGVSF